MLTSSAVADGLVYFGNTEAYVTAVALADGKMKGMTWTEILVHSSPVLVDEDLYVVSDDDYLYALDRTLRFATPKDSPSAAKP